MSAIITLTAGIYLWWFYTRKEENFGWVNGVFSVFGMLLFWATLIRVFIWGVW